MEREHAGLTQPSAIYNVAWEHNCHSHPGEQPGRSANAEQSQPRAAVPSLVWVQRDKDMSTQNKCASVHSHTDPGKPLKCPSTH